MARRILRQIGTVTPVNSTVARFRLPLGTSISRYMLRFTGTLTVGVAVATILEDSPYAYLRSVDLVLNGSFPLRSLDGRGYFFLNRIQQGTPPQVTAPAAAIGASAFVAELAIDVRQPELLAPVDSAFIMDSRLLNALELVFTFGADADVATPGGGGTAVLSALSIAIFSEEVADQGGPTSRMQVSRIQQAVAATGDLDVQLQALGPAYRGVAVHATSGNADPLRATSDDTIIGTISLIADNVIRWHDQSQYRLLRADNKILYSLETMPAGWLWLDFARSRTLRDLLLTQRTRQLILRTNIAAAPANTFLQVYPMNALLLVRRQAPTAAAQLRR